MVEQIHGKNPQGCVAVEGSEHDDGYRDGVSCGRRHHLKVEVANLISGSRLCAQDGVLENTQTLGRSQSQVDVCRDAHSNRGSKLTPHSLTPCRKAYARRTLPVTDVRVEELRGRFLEDWCEAHAAARDVT